MASSSSSSSCGLVICLLMVVVVSVIASSEAANVEKAASILEWPSETMSSMYEAMDEDEEDGDGGFARRSLFWRTMHYYISYGALSANRIPCPPRSGRSYYTHNCFKARGPVHPYTRGCSRISRCRR